MNATRKQCANCGTLHELDHDGTCDSCHEDEWRLWCTAHKAVVPTVVCAECSAISSFQFDSGFELAAMWSRIQKCRRPPGSSAFSLPPAPRNVIPAPIPAEARW